MTQDQIRRALDTVSMTQQQMDKLRSALDARLPETADPKQYYTWRKPEKRYRPAGLVAVLALVLVVFLGMQMLPSIQVSQTQAQSSFAEFYQSDLYKAALEWAKVLKPYEKYGVNGPPTVSAMPEPYFEYHCYNNEMKEKLDFICEKYGLSLVGESDFVEDYTELLSYTGGRNILRKREDVHYSVYGGWYYSDGGFRSGGEITMYQDTLWPYPIDFEFQCVPKTTFDELMVYVVSFQNYESWEYTASNGVPVLIAKAEEYAYLFAETEDSVLFIRVNDQNLGDNRIFEMTMSREALEAFAEAFDFSMSVDAEITVQEPPPDPNRIRVLDDTDLYSAPHENANIIGTLSAGEVHELVKADHFNGSQWALIAEGWARAEDLELYYEETS